MFSALRQGNLFYILEKGESPKLKVGYVVSVSAPQPKYNMGQPFSMEQTVDITVKVGDENQEFKQVPGSLSIANFGLSNIVISETKEEMSKEVDTMIRNSKQIIESVPYHENVIVAGEEILKELNPQFAKQKDQEDKINNLETKVEGIEGTLDDIKQMLAKALKNDKIL